MSTLLIQFTIPCALIEGLRDDIKSVVLVQRPSTLDTACSLALLQEEVLDSAKRREYRRSDQRILPKHPGPPRSALPLPLPPRGDKLPPVILPEERKLIDSTKSISEKLSALKSYRRAKGLCDLCAEKWSRDHKCAATVQLHVVQEVMELFSLDADNDSASVASEGQLFVALSRDAVTGSSGCRTIRFAGSIQEKEVLILIDSGSSHSFISKHIADSLAGVNPWTALSECRLLMVESWNVFLICLMPCGVCRY